MIKLGIVIRSKIELFKGYLNEINYFYIFPIILLIIGFIILLIHVLYEVSFNPQKYQ